MNLVIVMIYCILLYVWSYVKQATVVVLCRGDYPMHPVGAPPVRRGEEYRRPEGDLDLRTSYAQQYTRAYTDD